MFISFMGKGGKEYKMRYLSFLGSWINIVAQPSPHLTDQSDRRDAQLLSGMAFVLAILMLLQNITIFDKYSPSDALFWAFWGVFLLTSTVYVISRTKYQRLARTLFVLGLFVLVLFITILESIKYMTLTPLLWMIVPVLLAWMFTGVREIIIITAVTLAAFFTICLIYPMFYNAMLIMPIIILLSTSSLTILYTQYQNKSAMVNALQAEKLYQTNEELEQLLQNSNQQLQSELKERTRLDTALREAQHIETVGVMAGALAHDFNNFLSEISLYTSLSQSRLNDTSPIQKYLWQISKSAERASLLSAKLLTYAEGSKPSEIKPIALCTEVREICAILQQRKRYVTLVVNISCKSSHTIMASQLEIQQLLMNLIINAGEAIPHSGGKIFVSVCKIDVKPKDVKTYISSLQPQPGRYIQLKVKDTGCGMDDATQKRIFEPFFTTKTDKKAGRGLGLSATLGIIRSYDGALRLESARGRGTTFTVLFPVSSMVNEHALELTK